MHRSRFIFTKIHKWSTDLVRSETATLEALLPKVGYISS